MLWQRPQERPTAPAAACAEARSGAFASVSAAARALSRAALKPGASLQISALARVARPDSGPEPLGRLAAKVVRLA